MFASASPAFTSAAYGATLPRRVLPQQRPTPAPLSPGYLALEITEIAAKDNGSGTITTLESTEAPFFRAPGVSVTPVESAFTDSVRRNSFRFCTYINPGEGGGTHPVWTSTPLESAIVFALAAHSSPVNHLESALRSIRGQEGPSAASGQQSARGCAGRAKARPTAQEIGPKT